METLSRFFLTVLFPLNREVTVQSGAWFSSLGQVPAGQQLRLWAALPPGLWGRLGCPETWAGGKVEERGSPTVPGVERARLEQRGPPRSAASSCCPGCGSTAHRHVTRRVPATRVCPGGCFQTRSAEPKSDTAFLVGRYSGASVRCDSTWTSREGAAPKHMPEDRVRGGKGVCGRVPCCCCCSEIGRCFKPFRGVFFGRQSVGPGARERQGAEIREHHGQAA